MSDVPVVTGSNRVLPRPKEVAATLVTSSRDVRTPQEVVDLARLALIAAEIDPVALGTRDVGEALVLLWSKATNTEAIRWLCGAMCNINFRCPNNRVVHGTERMQEALVLGLTTASCDDDVRLVCSAVCSVTTDPTPEDVLRLYGRPNVVECFCSAARLVDSAECARWWCSAISNICATVTDNEEAFGGNPLLRDALVLVAESCTTADSARSFLNVVASLTRSSDLSKDTMSVEAVVKCVVAAFRWIHDVAGAKAVDAALANLASSPARRKLLALPAIRDMWIACTNMYLKAEVREPTAEPTAAAVSSPTGDMSSARIASHCMSLCNLTSGCLTAKTLFYTEATVMSLSRLAFGIVTPRSPAAQWWCAAVVNVVSAVERRSSNLFLTEPVKDALQHLASVLDGGAESVRWYCRAVELIREAADAANDHFADAAMRSAMSCVFRSIQTSRGYYQWCCALIALCDASHGAFAAEEVVGHLRHALHEAQEAETVQAVCETISAIVLDAPSKASVFVDKLLMNALVHATALLDGLAALHWSRALLHLVQYCDASFRDNFATPDVRNALIHVGWVACDHQDAIAEFSHLLCSLTAHHPNNVLFYRTIEMRQVLFELGFRSECVAAVRWLSGVLCNLTSRDYDAQVWIAGASADEAHDGSDRRTMEDDGGDDVEGRRLPPPPQLDTTLPPPPLTIHDALVAMMSQAEVLDDDAVIWLARAVQHTTVHPCNQRLCGTESFRDAFVALCEASSSEEAATWLCTSLCNLAGTLSDNKQLFACEATRNAMAQMSQYAQGSDGLLWWIAAATTLASHPQSRRLFCDENTCRVLLRFSKIPMSDEVVERMCVLVSVLCKSTPTRIVAEKWDKVLRRIDSMALSDKTQEWHRRALAAVAEKLRQDLPERAGPRPSLVESMTGGGISTASGTWQKKTVAFAKLRVAQQKSHLS